MYAGLIKTTRFVLVQLIKAARFVLVRLIKVARFVLVQLIGSVQLIYFLSAYRITVQMCDNNRLDVQDDR